MKAEIHPEYSLVDVRCACGNSWKTRSTMNLLKVEVCSSCHPFFTGEQRIVDVEGRVDRFKKRYGLE